MVNPLWELAGQFLIRVNSASLMHDAGVQCRLHPTLEGREVGRGYRVEGTNVCL